MNVDMHEAAKLVSIAIGGLSDEEIKKAVLMALIARDKQDLLVDPATLTSTSVLATDVKPE